MRRKKKPVFETEIRFTFRSGKQKKRKRRGAKKKEREKEKNSENSAPRFYSFFLPLEREKREKSLSFRPRTFASSPFANKDPTMSSRSAASSPLLLLSALLLCASTWAQVRVSSAEMSENWTTGFFPSRPAAPTGKHDSTFLPHIGSCLS